MRTWLVLETSSAILSIFVYLPKRPIKLGKDLLRYLRAALGCKSGSKDRRSSLRSIYPSDLNHFRRQWCVWLSSVGRANWERDVHIGNACNKWILLPVRISPEYKHIPSPRSTIRRLLTYYPTDRIFALLLHEYPNHKYSYLGYPCNSDRLRLQSNQLTSCT